MGVKPSAQQCSIAMSDPTSVRQQITALLQEASRPGGGAQRITLDEAQVAEATSDEGLLTMNDAMERLAAFDPRGARVVQLRALGGQAAT